jgi:predicted dithiol-disulfide oxidoreductase (DUF899 family)
MKPSSSPAAVAALPPVVSRDEWLAARKALLAQEKAATHQRDAVTAARRRLPMVRVDKPYVFAGPDGPVTLLELFAGRRQLSVHHFMWFEAEQKHCHGCTMAADAGFNNPHLRERLAEHDVTFVAISRAPLAKIQSAQQEHGWTFPWYSSHGTDFNYDYHVTLDETKAPIEFNYRTKVELLEHGFTAGMLKEDWPVNSIFLRDGDIVYHTYSASARGLDQLYHPNAFLDLTPYGRQEDWEDSPSGWPQYSTPA